MAFKFRRSRQAFSKAMDLFNTKQDPQFPYLLTGQRKSRQRGQDRWAGQQQVMQQQIDTARTRDPIIFRIINYFDQLALGPGITITTIDKTLAPLIRGIWRVNDLGAAQHQWAVELAASSNLFIHVPKLKSKTNKDGTPAIPRMDVIPSSQIEKIATKDGEVWYYRRVWEEQISNPPKVGEQKNSPTETVITQVRYLDIPPDEMVHIKINAGAGELRGTSMFQPVVSWSQLYGRTIETIWLMAIARSMFFVQAKIPSGNKDTLQDFINEIESQLVTRTDPQGMEYETVPTGQMLATGDNVELVTISSDVKGGSLDSEIRRILLMVAAGTGIPEVMLSDGNQANLASSTTQSDPFFRLMQSFQNAIKSAIEKSTAMALDRMAEVEVTMPPLEPDMDHPIEFVDVNAPDILSKDLATLAPAVATLVDNEVISRKEAAVRLGVDWEEMQEQIKEEREAGFAPKSAPAAPGGLGGGALPFGEESRPRADKLVPRSEALRMAAQIMLGQKSDVAKDDEGDPRHEETFNMMKRVRGEMHTELDKLRDALLAAGTNRGEAAEATELFEREVLERFKMLTGKSWKLGIKEVGDAKR